MADKSRNHAPDPACTAPVQWSGALVTASYLAALLFITFPHIDLIVSSQFTAADGEGFPMAQFTLLRFANELVPALAWAMAGIIVIGLLVSYIGRRSFLTLSIRQLWFLALSFGIGPGLIANTLLKDNWGRARPRDITQFGGALDFSPPVLFSDQCASNCSFVSGDASLAFTFLAVALILPKRRLIPIGAALLFGITIGAARVVQGAHFLSDVLFAGLFMTLTVVVVHWAIIEQPRQGWFECFKLSTGSPHSPNPDKSSLTLRRAFWLMFRATPEDLHVDQDSRDSPPSPSSG